MKRRPFQQQQEQQKHKNQSIYSKDIVKCKKGLYKSLRKKICRKMFEKILIDLGKNRLGDSSKTLCNLSVMNFEAIGRC